MNTLVLFALLACTLIGFVVGAIVGAVLGYDMSETKHMKKPKEMKLETMVVTEEEIERAKRADILREVKSRDMKTKVIYPSAEDKEWFRKRFAAWREDIDDSEG